MNRRNSLKPKEREPSKINAKTEQKEISMSRNSYIPSVLPEWNNWCPHNSNIDRKSVNTGPPNPFEYNKSISRVGWKGRVEYALDHFEKSSELDKNLLVCLLECVVTTVIGLASNQVLPGEYLHCCILYLENIKNEFGEYPANIAAFIELATLKLPKEDHDLIGNFLKEDLTSESSNTVITRLPKSLQKSHRK